MTPSLESVASRPVVWRVLAALAIVSAGMLAGCSLDEVTVPDGGDLLVAEAHLQAGQGDQFVLLHRAFQGRSVRGEYDASVALRMPNGETMPFRTRSSTCVGGLAPGRPDSLRVQVTCYAPSDIDTLRIEPGGTYELDVLSATGERLRGRTTVPQDFLLRRPAYPGTVAFPVCSLPPRTNFPLEWTRAEGAWSYLAVLDITGLAGALEGTGIDTPDRLELTGLAISASDTTLVMPRDFGLFELAHVSTELLIYLQDGFPAGVTVGVRLLALDRNYVNAIRAGSFNPSGPIRTSSVVGDGAGVFASYTQRNLFIVVEDDSALPACAGRV